MRHTTCTLLFLIRDAEILLAMKKRGFGSGKWNGVGGKVEPGESIEQAMIRECQEEIAVTPLQYQKVALHTFIYRPTRQTVQAHTYLCTDWDGEPVETDEMAPRWFQKNAIPYDKMWIDDQYWLPQILAGETVRTQFTFGANDKLLSKTISELA